MKSEHTSSNIDNDIWDELFVLAVLPSRDQSLVNRWVRVAINVDQEGRGHQVGRGLGLFVQHVVVGITDQWTVVGVVEQLFRELK